MWAARKVVAAVGLVVTGGGGGKKVVTGRDKEGDVRKVDSLTRTAVDSNQKKTKVVLRKGREGTWLRVRGRAFHPLDAGPPLAMTQTES